MPTYDERDNLNWHHKDGTKCDVFWSDKDRPGGWRCTEHQQKLHTDPKES